MNKHSATVFLCFVVWGVLPAFWKLLGGVDSVYILASRTFWSLAVSGAGVLISGEAGTLRSALKNRSTVLILAAASLFITVNWGTYIWCVTNGHVLDASLAYYINPILTILSGAVIYKERLTKLQWLSVALAAAGVAYPMLVEGQFPYLAMVMALSFALYSVIKKKVTVPSNVGIFTEMLFVSPFALAFMVIMELKGLGAVSSGALSGWSVLLLPAAGAVTYLPLALFSYGVQGTSMSLTGVLMYVNPTLQMLLGLVLYGEELTTTKTVTFALVWAAVAIFILAGRAQQKRQNAEETKETVKV